MKKICFSLFLIFLIAQSAFCEDFVSADPVETSVTADSITINVTTPGLAAVIAEPGSNISLISNVGNISIHNVGSSTQEIAAVHSTGGSINFNKNGNSADPIEIISDQGYAVAAFSGGQITFSKAIYIESHLEGIHSNVGSTINLSGMTHGTMSEGRYILSAQGGTINGSGSAEYILDGRIYAFEGGSITLTMDMNSVFTGSTALQSDADKINLTLSSNSVWNVVEESTLSSLKINSGTSVIFDFADNNKDNPYLIHTGELNLESEAKLVFNLDGTTISEGDSFTLFDVSGNFIHNGPSQYITTTDGLWQFSYTTDDWQTYTITGKTLVPEPSLPTILLVGVAVLGLRRRRPRM